MTSRMIGASLGCLGLMALAGCYQVPQSTAASYEDGTIAASDQPAGGSVTISTVGMPSTGWVVIHEMRNGKPVVPASIGNVYVPAGPSKNVVVALSTPVKAGDQVMAMLHLDTGVPKVYEFGNGGNEVQDKPVIRNGKPVATVVTLR